AKDKAVTGLTKGVLNQFVSNISQNVEEILALKSFPTFRQTLRLQCITISVGPWTGPVQWTTTGLDQSSPVPVLTGTGPK
ncbi:27474_t:CDS:2, partial [Racocetra persica]